MNWPYARDLLKQFPPSLPVCVCMWAGGGGGMGRKKGERQVVPGFQLLFHK